MLEVRKFSAPMVSLERCMTGLQVKEVIPLRIRVADPSALLWLGTACFYSASCYLDCLIIVGQS
jgi:hypothetical protein